jgi:hypothetical protein
MENYLEEAELPEHTGDLECMAHHEAGHLVIAAAQNLRLMSEGLAVAVDPPARGIAFYCKHPDSSDRSVKRILISTFAGFMAQARFCKGNGHREYPNAAGWPIPNSCDLAEARDVLLRQLLNCDLAKLGEETDGLIEQHWRAIEGLASTLLAKAFEELTCRFKNGKPWFEGSTTAKWIRGDEVVTILSQLGISASCVAEC